jgi:hypothetical protein
MLKSEKEEPESSFRLQSSRFWLVNDWHKLMQQLIMNNQNLLLLVPSIYFLGRKMKNYTFFYFCGSRMSYSFYFCGGRMSKLLFE